MTSVAGASEFSASRTLQLASSPVRTSFGWSRRRLHVASRILLVMAAAGTAGYLLSGPVRRCLALAWLLGVATLSYGVARRARSDAAVLSIDHRGILDRRLMPRRIAWQEIETFCAVGDQSRVIDLRLRSPDVVLAGTRWPVRIGARLQTGFAIPAVTISMLLLDGSVSELMDAIACYRPDLLDASNRRAHASRQA